MTDLSLLSGFIAGLLASTHCVFMCGAITILIAQERYGIWPHICRIFVYTLLALTAYYLTAPAFVLPHWLLGVGLIAAGVASYFPFGSSQSSGCSGCPGGQLLEHVEHKPVSAISRTLIWFWGFLPCPFVIMMVSTSLALQNPVDIVLFMTSFGIGTLPALLSVSYGSRKLVSKLALRKGWLETGLVCLGLWTVFFSMHSNHDEHVGHEHHARVINATVSILCS